MVADIVLKQGGAFGGWLAEVNTPDICVASCPGYIMESSPSSAPPLCRRFFHLDLFAMDVSRLIFLMQIKTWVLFFLASEMRLGRGDVNATNVFQSRS